MELEAGSSVGSPLEVLKAVGLGQGVRRKMPLTLLMKEIVTPDENNITRLPSVASNTEIFHELECSEIEFEEHLKLSFQTGVAEALHCTVSFMNGRRHFSEHRRRIHVGKVWSETVEFSDEQLSNCSTPFVNSLNREVEKRRYSDSNLNDEQRDDICRKVIKSVYKGATHFISSVDLGVMFSIIAEEKETIDGEKQDVDVSANIETLVKARLGGGAKKLSKHLARNLHRRISENWIGKLGTDDKPKEMGRIGCKVSPIWSVIKDEGWRESVKRVCSEILPVPVDEKEPIVIKAAGASPRYLKVFDNSAEGAKKQRTSKWRVGGTATKSEASKIHVIKHGKIKDGDGGTAISLYTEIDGQRIFLTAKKGILAAKGFQMGKGSKFVLVSPNEYTKTCAVSEWQSGEPLCVRQAERKRKFAIFGFSSPLFVAFPTKEGSDATPVMKTARDISNAVDWMGQFLIEHLM